MERENERKIGLSRTIVDYIIIQFLSYKYSFARTILFPIDAVDDIDISTARGQTLAKSVAPSFVVLFVYSGIK